MPKPPDFTNVFSATRDAITVKRVYGKPYEANGVVVIPAASVQGGGGGGGDPSGGGGGGFGVRARPVGAYVIRGQEVSWVPATDRTRIILGGQLLALVAMLLASIGWIARSRR